MNEESFNILMESLNQALEYERGERQDLRVTILPAPQRAEQPTAATTSSLKKAITQELEALTEDNLRQVVYYVAFLKFQERFKTVAAEGQPATRAMAG